MRSGRSVGGRREGCRRGNSLLSYLFVSSSRGTRCGFLAIRNAASFLMDVEKLFVGGHVERLDFLTERRGDSLAVILGALFISLVVDEWCIH